MKSRHHEISNPSDLSQLFRDIPIWMKFIGCVFVALPAIGIIAYVINFWGTPCSEKQNDWGSFGSYVNGISSPFLAFIGVFVTISLYHISTKLRQMERRPLARISVEDTGNIIAVNLENAGIGPLTVDSLAVFDEENTTKKSLIDWFKNEKFDFIDWDTVVWDASDFVIKPSKKLVLLKLSNNPKKEGDDTYYRDEVRRALSKLHIKIIYSDLFGVEMPTVSVSLESFKNRI